MKCNNCKSSEMYCTFETLRMDNKKYTPYVCPTCGDQEFIEILPFKRRRNCIDSVALGLTSLCTVVITLYVGLNIDKFITTH